MKSQPIDLDPDIEHMSEEDQAYYQDLYPEMHSFDINSVPKVTVQSPGITSGRKFIVSSFLLVLMIWATAFNISDTAMEYLLSYIHYFLSLFMGEIGQNGLAACGLSVSTAFPASLYLCRKQLGLGTTDSFKKYVVCPDPDCCSLYDINDCFTIVNGKQVPRKCSRAIYKRNAFYRTCDTPLLKANVVKNGGIYHVPKKIFCQKDITSQIQSILSRPGYEKYCQEWRDRKSTEGTYEDVYDGKIWKEVQDKEIFFVNDHDMGLLLNFDFFQPFKNRNKSVGIIYLALLNLPRSIRYHTSNMIVAGIIPSLDYMDKDGKTKHEPKHMNTFVKPLVDELNELWREGKRIMTHDHPAEGILMHAMLIGVSCDSPASRKILGFLAHSAIKGCTKCKHEFSGKVGEKRYHGYDKANWVRRSNKAHREHCAAIRRAPNDTKASELEKKYGCRYSVLLELDYFDPIRYNAIDAMHLLFLGIAKSFFEMLIDKGILTDVKLSQITENLENMNTSSRKSWLPKNIGSHWKYFNAFEWKQWVLTYSLPAFRKVIPGEYLEIWAVFVEACQLISKPVVSQQDINDADLKFCEYIRLLQKKFGHEVIKPNHHMSCHLKECIEDFGGVYTTWLFAFERLNGFLGDYKTNNKVIEVTLMRKVLSDSMLATKSFELPKTFFESCSLPPSKTCIFKPDEIQHLSQSKKQVSHLPISECSRSWTEISHVKLPKAITSSPGLKSDFVQKIDDDDLNLLYQMYQTMYPEAEFNLNDLGAMSLKFDTIDLGCERFSSGNTNQSKLCMILANWCNADGTIDTETSNLRLGLIKYFFRHNLRISGQCNTHVLCSVQWFSDFQDSKLPTGYYDPVQVFRKKRVSFGPAIFMPVQRIRHKCAYAFTEVNGYKDCIVVSPISFEIYE